MKYALLSSLLVVALSGCQETAPPTINKTAQDNPVTEEQKSKPAEVEITEKISVSDMDFSLTPTDTDCLLNTPAGESLPLGVNPACRFHRDSSGDVQVVNGHHGPVFLVVSSLKKPQSDDCVSRKAAVTISDSKVFVEPAISSTASCLKNTSLDRIFFLAPRFDGLPYPNK